MSMKNSVKRRMKKEKAREEKKNALRVRVKRGSVYGSFMDSALANFEKYYFKLAGVRLNELAMSFPIERIIELLVSHPEAYAGAVVVTNRIELFQEEFKKNKIDYCTLSTMREDLPDSSRPTGFVVDREWVLDPKTPKKMKDDVIRACKIGLMRETYMLEDMEKLNNGVWL